MSERDSPCWPRGRRRRETECVRHPPYPPFPPFPPYPPFPSYPPAAPCAPSPCPPPCPPPPCSSSSSSSSPSSSSSSSASSSSSSPPCTEPLGQPSSIFQVTSIELQPDPVEARFTRGTGLQTIASKLVVSTVPVQSDAILDFKRINQLPYRALLYELRDNAGGVSGVVPNWFGVAIPNPDTF